MELWSFEFKRRLQFPYIVQLPLTMRLNICNIECQPVLAALDFYQTLHSLWGVCAMLSAKNVKFLSHFKLKPAIACIRALTTIWGSSQRVPANTAVYSALIA